MSKYTLRIEFKLEDMWIGAYWRRTAEIFGEHVTFDLWVCLVPCLPIHFSRETSL